MTHLASGAALFALAFALFPSVSETIHGACDCGVLRSTGGTPLPTLTDAGIGG
jgi:hypothetical protein